MYFTGENATDADISRFRAKVQRTAGCWNWTAAKDDCGYGLTRFAGKVERAHRVAYVASGGIVPAGLVVMHTCDNPSCCRPNHLALGTRGDNNRDRAAKGRSAASRRKLTDAEVLEIRAGAHGPTATAKQFGITPQHVCAIRRGAHWRT